MGMYPAVVRHVLAPAYDLVRGTATMKRLHHLEGSQWWPRERIEEQQSSHLRDLISHAYDHVPYYRRVMDERGLRPADIRDSTDLPKLPVLTKSAINAKRADLLSRAITANQLTTGWSGGTTGERLNFHSTRRERLTYAYARWALMFEWTGVKLGEPHVSIRQQSDSRTGLLKELSFRVQRLTKVDTMLVREEHLGRIVDILDRARPRAVFSYPSALALIASYVKSTGGRSPYIDAICLGGEELLPRQREVLAEVFGGRQYVRYGSNELHEVAGQCEAREGLHILAEDFIIEVVDDSGAPVPPGERGRLLVTSLHNHGMPFIRYENGDIGRLLPEPCACGRGLPLMDWRVGRTREYADSRSGSHVAAMEIDLGRFLPSGVVQYQLVQEDYEEFALRAVPVREPHMDEWDKVGADIARVLGDKLRTNVSVRVALVDRIEMNLSGKRLSFISHVGLDARASGTAGFPLRGQSSWAEEKAS